MNRWYPSSRGRRLALLLLASLSSLALAPVARAAPVRAGPIVGEIQSVKLDAPGDVWSGGSMVVSGKTVILPRNLLLDLPANRLTLQQLHAQAPAACRLVGQTGLARTDACNPRGAGAIATIHANRTDAGNVIAGDVFIQKGLDVVSGQITYVDHDQGYFRMDGRPGDPASGTMVRLNDPTGRHTVQVGLGCAGGPNCSPDPRFTLDPDNYTNVFSTGYPWCIPSTVERPFADVLGVGATLARANADGTGDVLCPSTNRTVNGGRPVDDSRRFAPIRVGDSVTAEGNMETVGGVTFLSAHTSMVAVALTTKDLPGQPDYLFLDEAEIDAPGFENDRVRSLFIGFTTLPSDVLIWSIHRDPATNEAHEFPLASARGCDLAAGPGTCLLQGGFNQPTRDLIFKIRHDVDFLLQGAALTAHSPCAHLRADPRFAALGVCPGAAFDGRGTFEEEFAILSPIPREIQARTGHALANPGLVSLDVKGAATPNGQYLFPFGVGLGGIGFPEFVEIDLGQLAKPFAFSGIPWAMDRRLAPGGCDGACEAGPQPLVPFPYDGLDPRTQAALPQGSWFDPSFTASPLTRTPDRVLSYVDGALDLFDGDATVLAWPPAAPAAIAIVPTPEVALVCQATTGNAPPVAVADSATALPGVPIAIPVLANDSDANGDPLVVTGVTDGAGGTAVAGASSVTYTPAAGFAGTDAFAYTIADGQGGTATATVLVTVLGSTNTPPVAVPDGATTGAGLPVAIPVLANDGDADGDVLSVVSVTQGLNGSVTTDGVSVSYVPNAGFSGLDSVTYTVSDGRGGSASALVTITVIAPANAAPVATSDGATTDAGVRVPIAVLANDSDADGDPLAVVAVTPGANGAVTTDGTTVFYAPAPGFAGSDSFTYTISDGLAQASALVTVTVRVNQPPVATNDAATTDEGSAVTIAVLANDRDANGDLLAVTGASQGANGSVTHTATAVTYTPNLGFKGVDSFAYAVSDGRGGTASAVVTVQVRAILGLAVTAAQYRLANAEWTVSGTSNVPNATITIRVGPSLLGTPLLGTTVADATGAWTFRQRGSPIAPDATRTVSVRSSTGATLTAVPVLVR